MLRRHPGSTLFPYTTLFRSFQQRNVQTGWDILLLPVERSSDTTWKPGAPAPFLSGPEDESAAMFSPDGRWVAYGANETGRDRKSTRLNSSHGYISYAVFCLK